MSVDGGELHTRLRIARKRSGLTQAEMALRAGIALNTLKQYESGRIKPGAEALAGYVRVGVNVVYVLTGEGDTLLAKQSEPGSGSVLIRESANGRSREFSLPKIVESMRTIILGIEDCLSELQLQMTDEKKMELTQLLFEEFAEAGTPPRLSTIRRFVRTATKH